MKKYFPFFPSSRRRPINHVREESRIESRYKLDPHFRLFVIWQEILVLFLSSRTALSCADVWLSVCFSRRRSRVSQPTNDVLSKRKNDKV